MLYFIGVVSIHSVTMSLKLYQMYYFVCSLVLEKSTRAFSSFCASLLHHKLCFTYFLHSFNPFWAFAVIAVIAVIGQHISDLRWRTIPLSAPTLILILASVWLSPAPSRLSYAWQIKLSDSWVFCQSVWKLTHSTTALFCAWIFQTILFDEIFTWRWKLTWPFCTQCHHFVSPLLPASWHDFHSGLHCPCFTDS